MVLKKPDPDGTADESFVREQGSFPHQRRHPRVDVPLLVQYRFGPGEPVRIDYTLNLSEAGLFILTEDEQPPGTRVMIQITTRDRHEIIQGEGTVVRTANDGTAIHLDRFPDEGRQALVDVVNRVLADQEQTQDIPRPAQSWESSVLGAHESDPLLTTRDARVRSSGPKVRGRGAKGEAPKGK